MAGVWGKSPYDTSGADPTRANAYGVVNQFARAKPLAAGAPGFRALDPAAAATAKAGTSPTTGTGIAPPLAGGGRPTPAPVADQTAGSNVGGTESGAGILENWFNQRASGTDPAYEYTMRRGMDAIDRRMAAGGSFNSGARGEQLSDFSANAGAHRMGQLDSLAGGASGEHQGRLNSMFQQMLGLAGGQAGLAGAYDISAANNMSNTDSAILQMMLNKAGVEGKADQGFLNNLFSMILLGARK